mmetsp:Transcript_52820/g.146664  ORF Transcript_52820/g.146664 Transcript_52820/m.146664 type:complete len:212 (+) Transcript_52820:1810-2445(+)
MYRFRWAPPRTPNLAQPSLRQGLRSGPAGSRMKCRVLGQSAWRMTAIHSLNVSSVRSTPLQPTIISIDLMAPLASAGPIFCPPLPSSSRAKPVTTIQWLVTCLWSLRLATPLTLSSSGCFTSNVWSNRCQFTSPLAPAARVPPSPLLPIACETASAHLTIISFDSAERVNIRSAVRRSKLYLSASGTMEAVISSTSSSRTAPAGVSEVISR